MEFLKRAENSGLRKGRNLPALRPQQQELVALSIRSRKFLVSVSRHAALTPRYGVSDWPEEDPWPGLGEGLAEGTGSGDQEPGEQARRVQDQRLCWQRSQL